MNCNSCRLETQESAVLARKILKGRRKKTKNKPDNYEKKVYAHP